jgi:hypothetical protein
MAARGVVGYDGQGGGQQSSASNGEQRAHLQAMARSSRRPPTEC